MLMSSKVGPVNNNGEQQITIYNNFWGGSRTRLWKKEDVDSFQKLEKKVYKQTGVYTAAAGVLGAITSLILSKKGIKNINIMSTTITSTALGFLAGIFKGQYDIGKFISKTDSKG